VFVLSLTAFKVSSGEKINTVGGFTTHRYIRPGILFWMVGAGR
jgi:hypothetical protein